MQKQIRPENFDPNEVCLCEEPDPKYRKGFEHGETKTSYCISCHTDRTEYVFTEEDVSSADDGIVFTEIDESSVDVGTANDITEEEPPTLESHLKISVNHVSIDSINKAASLRPGHHIAWARDKRKMSGILNLKYSHHAIVETNNGTHLGIIHFARDQNNNKIMRIHRSRLEITSNEDMKYDTLYCIQYPQRVLDENPPELVLKRARARLGEESYNLATNNCESFVGHCKMRVSHSLQVYNRFISTIKNLRKALVPLSAMPKVVVWIIQFFSAEMVEALASLGKHLTYVNVIGAILYIVMEGIVLTADITQLYNARRDRRIKDKKVFSKAIAKRVALFVGRVAVGTSFSIGAGLAGAAAGAAMGSFIPIVGTALGAGVGGIVGSVAGGVGGVAALEGSRTIVWSFWNSENVTSIDQLRLGDHIVLNGRRFLHPRCHAIVTEIDEGNDRIRVVRNRHKHGVIEEYITFEKMKRIKYSFASCYPPELVIKRARKKLGETRYNIATFNCKTFATKQKMREELNI